VKAPRRAAIGAASEPARRGDPDDGERAHRIALNAHATPASRSVAGRKNPA
jgi:hypothetical protein